ncbi:MAG TPA: metallophosphoesterase family protein [Sedimentisphaerales bacterium]|jgi:putative phosphoesterase|nr:metallophosphoesterase family protein [Sedimentisphaerales bacterium]HNU31890.1 metallophosphoesterase family protein [Sedimentisphaerales bacterium]
MAKPIGVISDTHNLLREEARGRLQGCDLILHAGDVGSPSILEELRQIGRVVAVRGNMDKGPWASELEEVEHVEVDGRRICVIHDIDRLDLDPAAAGIDVVVYGHSHKPAVDRQDGVLYLNPGSAGPKRFDLPVSMAMLWIDSKAIHAELVDL